MISLKKIIWKTKNQITNIDHNNYCHKNNKIIIIQLNYLEWIRNKIFWNKLYNKSKLIKTNKELYNHHHKKNNCCIQIKKIKNLRNKVMLIKIK